MKCFIRSEGLTIISKKGKRQSATPKKSRRPHWLADVMLFYVETGVQFTNDFGDINEAFYTSLKSTYEAALVLGQKEELMGLFFPQGKESNK